MKYTMCTLMQQIIISNESKPKYYLNDGVRNLCVVFQNDARLGSRYVVFSDIDDGEEYYFAARSTEIGKDRFLIESLETCEEIGIAQILRESCDFKYQLSNYFEHYHICSSTESQAIRETMESLYRYGNTSRHYMRGFAVLSPYRDGFTAHIRSREHDYSIFCTVNLTARELECSLQLPHEVHPDFDNMVQGCLDSINESLDGTMEFLISEFSGIELTAYSSFKNAAITDDQLDRLLSRMMRIADKHFEMIRMVAE